jgi:hypothetical protein
LDDIDADFRSAYEHAKSGESKAEQNKVTVVHPTIWVQVSDNKVKPVEVEVGISNGFETEIISDKLSESDQVVVGTIKHRQPDFVSSFISRVAKPKEQ